MADLGGSGPTGHGEGLHIVYPEGLGETQTVKVAGTTECILRTSEPVIPHPYNHKTLFVVTPLLYLC